MKNIIKIILILITLQACSESNTDPTPIITTGSIQNNAEYIGGAPPPDSLLIQLATYKPSANQTFYVRKGTNNIPNTPLTTTFTTTATGTYTITLPPGTYSVIAQNKHDFEYNAIGVCEWIKQPDFVLNINQAETTQNKQYTISRNTCIEPAP